ncbi:hypothetical protein, variant 1 [Aphanomyces astaci]|uniref:BZIP domain-containing protein n=1 Tax=Aphanomyces astaci TaxID=112090 RepID=W4G0U5_APHAT|nr:hypothetical protein, variant 1 [Aphanomyces astaci]ETV73332.1 hypothetical protein, variant 1 [Aphanomyces astaci]|eukprot:XP_009837206.1 hypothetical protein, variant 1 [Aphanomyces astaci]
MNTYNNNDDEMSSQPQQQRHHHGYAVPPGPSPDSTYPPPCMMHDPDELLPSQHVSLPPPMEPSSSPGFDMTSAAFSQPMYPHHTTSSIFRDVDPLTSSSAAGASSYLRHDVGSTLSQPSHHHQVVDHHDLHYLGASSSSLSSWQPQHLNTSSVPTSSHPPPLSYEDQHHPTTIRSMHSTSFPLSSNHFTSATRIDTTPLESLQPATYPDLLHQYPNQSMGQLLQTPPVDHQLHFPAPLRSTFHPSTADDPLDNKKEKRKSQVRDASRRRRAKRKDEETRLRDRIQELTHHIQIMAGSSSSGADVRRPSTITPDDNNAALEEAYQQQLHIVHILQQKNFQYKEKLAQHEQFARLIQTGIQHLSTDDPQAAPQQLQILQQQQRLQLVPGTSSVRVATTAPGPTTNLLANSTTLAALTGTNVDVLTQWAKNIAVTSHRDLLASAREVHSIGKRNPLHVTTNIAMGWTTQLWMSQAGNAIEPSIVQVRSHKDVHRPKCCDCVAKTWEILTSVANGRRVYPDLLAVEVVNQVTPNELVVVVYRKSSVMGGSSSDHRDVVSVVYKAKPAADTCFIGVASFDHAGVAFLGN